MDLKITGRVALVTGAGQYMGRAIAHELAAEGVRVAVNDIVPEKAEDVAEEIRERGGEAVAAVADVTDRNGVAAAVARVAEELGPVDILVNNAGLPVPQHDDDTFESRASDFFVDSDPDWWQRWVDINYFGTLNCTQAVLAGMRERRWGRVVNVISDAGRVGEPRQAVYAGAKAGIAGFSKSVAREMGRYAITVNCVSLGSVLHEDWVRQWGEAADDRIGRMMKFYPMARGLDRLGIPEDAAFAVALLASDRAEWITGQVLSVSGGFTMA
jgi:NAD(P)-dependent dehydrogenase (short-subunit alcohol dehydrogenase family)